VASRTKRVRSLELIFSLACRLREEARLDYVHATMMYFIDAAPMNSSKRLQQLGFLSRQTCLQRRLQPVIVDGLVSLSWVCFLILDQVVDCLGSDASAKKKKWEVWGFWDTPKLSGTTRQEPKERDPRSIFNVSLNLRALCIFEIAKYLQ
jgi:hypothetical protein